MSYIYDISSLRVKYGLIVTNSRQYNMWSVRIYSLIQYQLIGFYDWDDVLMFIIIIIIIIIIPTYAQISRVKLILKLLRHVSVLIRHLQGVYSCVS